MSNLLSHNAFLHVLPEELTTALEAQALRKRFADGDLIFRRGDPGDGFYGVISGRVQVLGHGADGREHTLSYVGPGEWFGEISMLDGLPRTHDNVAKGDTELWFVPKREFQQMLRDMPELMRAVAELLGRRVRMLFGFVEDAVLLDLPSRLAKRLLELAADHGVETGEGVEIGLHLPQEGLAAMLGATREAVGKHLKRWEREGWIGLAYGKVVVTDRGKLGEVVGARH